MSEEIYEPPSSDVEQTGAPVLTPVKKPWPRWIIAIWLFLTLGMLANAIGRLVVEYLGSDVQFAKKISAGFFIIELALIYGVLKLNKFLVIATAALSILLGLYQLFRVVMMLASEPDLRTVILVFALYVIPSFLCAWYLLRPNFRELVERNYKYNETEKMRKYATKSLSKWS